MRAPFSRLVACALCLGAVTASVASAEQSLPSGFAAVPETTRPVSVVGASVYGGIGDNAGIDYAPVDPVLASMYSFGFLGGLSHGRRGPTTSYSLAAGTSFRFFPETRELLNLDRVGSVMVERRVSQHGRLRLSQTAQYTRFRQLTVVPVDPDDPGGELPNANPETSATIGQPFFTLTSGVNFSQSFGPRSSIWTDYAYRTDLNPDWSDRPQTHEARIRYSRAAGQRSSVWVGTSYRVGQTSYESGVPSIRANDVEGGFGYTRRATTIAASTGVTFVSRPDAAAGSVAGGSDYQVVGSVSINRMVGRSWNLGADYSRQVQFVTAFPDPFSSHQANASIGGQVGRRTSLSGQFGYWSGTATATVSNPDQRADGWRSTARVGFNLSRNAQMYALYNYTSNQFSEGALASLPPGVIPRSNWGGVRFGVDLWAPFVH